MPWYLKSDFLHVLVQLLYVIFCLLIYLACNCNIFGSENCDTTTNICPCSDTGICNCTTDSNIVGEKCDICANGFYGFPTCEGKEFYLKLTIYLYRLGESDISILE